MNNTKCRTAFLATMLAVMATFGLGQKSHAQSESISRQLIMENGCNYIREWLEDSGFRSEHAVTFQFIRGALIGAMLAEGMDRGNVEAVQELVFSEFLFERIQLDFCNENPDGSIFEIIQYISG